MWGVTLLPVSEASEPESDPDVCNASSSLPLQCTYRLDTGAIFEEVRSFSSDSRQQAPTTRVLDPLPSDSPDEAGVRSNTGALSVDPEHRGRQLPRLGHHFVAIGRGRHAEASAS
ncbi:hypothetical protein NDU88_002608 [Pleurodeles waltl]|uniref:Uncharacterized protein n=1 Tax=Pleurodeles waltl TaxID=8319 RepID=A0AAV7UB08_PLEWA|nr:hypothetical protein NDU88_002608 [Pleurodeles waltl]